MSVLTRTLAATLAKLSRYPRVRRWLRHLLETYRQADGVRTADLGYDVPEVTPIAVRPEAGSQPARRLNLLVPAISQAHVFGGIETALQVFDAMRREFDCARIIVTDESLPAPRSTAFYGAWPVIGMDQRPPPDDHIVPVGSRGDSTLSVHVNDYFIATAWWSAHLLFPIIDWQRQLGTTATTRRMLYLIQDFEPGFYPWSHRYLLAQATYAYPDKTVALINSDWLADYLDAQGFPFPVRRIIAPRFHPGLAAKRAQAECFHKERIVLVYGRPGVERNAFSLIVAALREWVALHDDPGRWKILSAGEPFDPVPLGKGVWLESLGKLDIDAYADLLCRTAIGLSLMVSPHPSYPPLEMAAFGVRVLTNRFANKDLARLTSFIQCPGPATPQQLGAALHELASRYDAESGRRVVSRAAIDWSDSFLANRQADTEWLAGLTDLLDLRECGRPNE